MNTGPIMSAHGDEMHLLDYLRVVRKRWAVVLSLFVLVVGAVAVYSFTTPPVYRATVQILFNLEKNPTMTFVKGESGYLQMKNSLEFFLTQKEIISNRSFADRVVRTLALDRNPYLLARKEALGGGFIDSILSAAADLFPWNRGSEDVEFDPFPGAESVRELDPVLTDFVLQDMEVVVEKHSNIIKINYYSDNPRFAAGMANGIGATFIEYNLELRLRPFRDAVDWLSGKLVELRSKVERSEKTLQKYKEGEGIVSFESKENVIIQEHKELVSQLIRTEARRQEAEIRYEQIKAVIDKPELLETVPDIMNNLVIQGLRKEELMIKKQLSELSEKFGPKHPRMIKIKTEFEVVQKNLYDEARKMLHTAKTEFEIARSREETLRRRIEQQKLAVLDMSRKAIDFNVVAGEAWSNKRFYELLLNKLQEASLSSGINVSNAQIVDYAVTPLGPIKPKRELNVVVAMIVGLFSGIIMAFFVEYMDDSIKDPDGVSELLGLACLGVVPGSAKEIDGTFELFSDPDSTVAEAYRSLRTSIRLSTLNTMNKVLLVTSAIPSEGKTTTALNLAAAMARAGEKVLVVDADLRRSSVHRVLGIDNSVGLTDMLISDGKAPGAIRSVAGVKNLSVLTAGTHTPHPAEFIGSGRMKSLVEALRGRFDRVILDSSPLLAVSDPLLLAGFADAVIVIIWGGSTSIDVIRKGLRTLEGINANVLGAVLNNLSAKRAGYNYYPYYGASDREGSTSV